RLTSHSCTAILLSGGTRARNAASCHGVPLSSQTKHAHTFLVGFTRSDGVWSLCKGQRKSISSLDSVPGPRPAALATSKHVNSLFTAYLHRSSGHYLSVAALPFPSRHQHHSDGTERNAQFSKLERGECLSKCAHKSTISERGGY